MSGLDIAEFCIWNGPEGETMADHVYSQRVIGDDVFNGRTEIETMPGWETRWPHLADCLASEGTVQGGVLLVKSRLTLPSPAQTLDAGSLKTHLAVSVQEPLMGDVSVVTRIYTMGQKVLELTNVIVPVKMGLCISPSRKNFGRHFCMDYGLCRKIPRRNDVSVRPRQSLAVSPYVKNSGLKSPHNVALACYVGNSASTMILNHPSRFVRSAYPVILEQTTKSVRLITNLHRHSYHPRHKSITPPSQSSIQVLSRRIIPGICILTHSIYNDTQ
jgi:hypothetical protein